MRRMIIGKTVLACLLTLSSCTARQDGSIEGSVSPPTAGVRAAAFRDGAAVLAADADARTGMFRLSLPAGAYEVRVNSPASPFPLVLTNVAVKAGATTVLAPIMLPAVTGTGSIAGSVQTGRDARVTLFAEGFERASVTAAGGGNYVFEGLPAGHYTVRASSPGYATEASSVSVAEDRKTVQDIRMLYITTIEGVDWNAGIIRARGVGLSPREAPTPTVRRELAKRAALVDAERAMVRAIELINVAPGQTLGSLLGSGNVTQRLSGYLQGYRIAAERDMDGGKIEVEIELPLTGAGGLSSSLPR